jgi:hypothetical protein
MSIRMAKALSSAPHRPPPMTTIEKMDWLLRIETVSKLHFYG